MWQVISGLIAAVLLMIGVFLLFFVLQTAIYRTRLFETMGRNLFVISFLVCFAEMLVGPYLISALVADIGTRWLISILSGVAAFGLIGIYLMIFPVSLERSFSVRLLVNLLNAPSQTMTKTAVEALHTREQIYELRYREMTEGGLTRLQDDKLILLPRGRLIARLYLLLGQSMGYPGGFNN
jgi:type IV secretory pathway VirB6-like protein